jgi:hypothetical protein
LACKNSAEFVAHIKTLTLDPNDKMISFDAEALFPSVPIKDCNDVIRCKLDTDADLLSRTKTDPTDICKLLDLCLSSSDFIFDGWRHTTKDSGPIGLSLMVCISQIWMMHTMEKPITIAHKRGVATPRHLTIYMDDCWGVMRHQPAPRHPGLCSSAQTFDPAADFNHCLDAVHPRVKFTREEEVEDSIAFLDVHPTCPNGRISTHIYRKLSNTNTIIKPQSNQHSNTITSTFKSEICRAHRLCSTPALVQKEVQFVLDVFKDNGYSRDSLQKIANSYQPPPLHEPRPPSSTTSHNNNSRREKQTRLDQNINNLFSILPLHNHDLDEESFQK